MGPSQDSDANNPKSLYEQAISCYVNKLNHNVSTLDGIQRTLRYLPAAVLSDIYFVMSQKTDLKDILFEQLSDLEIFERLLRFDPARQKLFHCLTALISSKKALASQLQKNFLLRYEFVNLTLQTAAGMIDETKLAPKRRTKLQKEKLFPLLKMESPLSLSVLTEILSSHDDDVVCASTSAAYIYPSKKSKKINKKLERDIVAQADAVLTTEYMSDLKYYVGADVIDFGMRLGTFLSEAGWLSESTEILYCVADNLRYMPTKPDTKTLIVRLDCLQRLLHSEAALYNFKLTEETFDEICDLLKEITPESVPTSLLANTYTQFSAMYFARSEYDDSHMWSVLALRHLNEHTPERIAIDVLRQAAKACVVKRDFQRANMLICQASHRARKVFGIKHQKYADTLLDYGFFLLNVDSVIQSIKIYKEALEIKRCIFGNRNFHVAVAHEDLSYAYYVHEYSTGNFDCAREHVEKAVDIMKDLVPNDHIMLASAKRVKALLLEEIALDKMSDGIDEEGLLKESEELHSFALQLSLEVFGEKNVQTAKHYGNLGRLYQTMNRFQEAERMHQKAIKIKTDLLGPYDYEVGLSIGHLASLYNYQMKKYRDAEELYLRSIEISLRLFGRSYSGLEYDYLGLCHVYETLREFEKYLQYANTLEHWQVLRLQNQNQNKSSYPALSEDCSLEQVKQQFFNMNITTMQNAKD